MSKHIIATVVNWGDKPSLGWGQPTYYGINVQGTYTAPYTYMIIFTHLPLWSILTGPVVSTLNYNYPYPFFY